MKRPPFVPGNYYHLFNRGRSRLPLFHEPADYHLVLEKMKLYSEKYDISVIAYALMPNHYHLLVRQNGAVRAGLLPQRIFNSYSKRYNRLYNHSGTLFEGPYKAMLVEDDGYLRHLCRYIHGNPVKDGLTRALDEWDYTNFPEWMGLRAGTLWSPEFVAEMFPDRDGYVAFVKEFLEE